MITQVQVTKGSSENTASLIRRFSKRVSTSGVLKKARRIKYRKRPASAFTKKKKALNRIAKEKKTDRARKLGELKNVRYKKFN